MDIDARSKRKYTSFILSILLHCLLLLWLIHTALKFHQAQDRLESASDNKRTLPAPISFDNRMLLPQLPQEELPALQALDTSIEPSLPVDQHVELSADSAEPILPLSGPLIESSTDPIQSNNAIDTETKEASGIAQETESILEGPSEEASTTSSIPFTSSLPLGQQGTIPVTHAPLPHTGPTKRRKKKKTSLPPGLTAAIFVKAFQNAARAETYAQSSHSHGTQTRGQAPAHVQERLDEWREFNYQQKIGRALVRACRLSQGYLHAEEDVKETLFVRLAIAQDGSFKVEGPTPFTGIKIVDDYLSSFFSKLDLPPIPKHLGTTTFIRPITIRISLRKGGNYIELRPIND